MDAKWLIAIVARHLYTYIDKVKATQTQTVILLRLGTS